MTGSLSKEETEKVHRVGMRACEALGKCRSALKRLQGKRSRRYAKKAMEEALKAINHLGQWGMHP